MAEFLKDPNTILVINGKPYRLVATEKPISFCPCDMCDLSDLCAGKDDTLPLYPLCSPIRTKTSFFFMEDWEAWNKQISDFCDLSKCKKALK